METLQRTANRGSVSTGYDVDNSLKLEADNTEIIYRANQEQPKKFGMVVVMVNWWELV